jgi:hypothetical protein
MFTLQGGADRYREGPSGEIVFGEVPTRRRHTRAHQHGLGSGYRKVDIWLHGKGNSNSHDARPVYYNHLDDKVDSDQ